MYIKYSYGNGWCGISKHNVLNANLLSVRTVAAILWEFWTDGWSFKDLFLKEFLRRGGDKGEMLICCIGGYICDNGWSAAISSWSRVHTTVVTSYPLSQI